MATLNPLEHTHTTAPPSISKKTFTIAGLLTSIYGLDELAPDLHDVACLWLLHPRLQTQECMAPLAAHAIAAWNHRVRQGRAGAHPHGLIAVSFDQRNHGSRLVDPVANEAWRSGNPRHAQDMFSIYHGTVTDLTHLLPYLPAYAFPPPSPHHLSSTHIALGISLGGHSAWQALLHDPAITAAIPIIGCPDYTRLMSDRAAKSKRASWTHSTPPGAAFLGSADFPPALLEEVRRWDPAAYLTAGTGFGAPGGEKEKEKKVQPQQRREHLDGAVLATFKERVARRLQGKRVLVLSGGADKLVPYAAGEPFLRLLKQVAVEKGVAVEDVVEEGVGHEMTESMAERAVEWICEVLLAGPVKGRGGVKEERVPPREKGSKM